jgi:hypothetical protein
MPRQTMTSDQSRPRNDLSYKKKGSVKKKKKKLSYKKKEAMRRLAVTKERIIDSNGLEEKTLALEQAVDSSRGGFSVAKYYLKNDPSIPPLPQDRKGIINYLRARRGLSADAC